MRGYFILCAVFACCVCIVQSGEKPKRQVNNGPAFFCYYATWAKYTRLRASAIDPFICTHIVVAFAKVQVTTQTAGIIAFDRSDENDVFPQMLGLKARNPNLKVLLAVGGWSHGTDKFVKVADNPTLLNSFVQNTVSYLKKFGFDGLDVDWEFPTSKPQFTRFIRAIRTEFNKVENSYLELTSAMSAGEATIISGYDIPALAPLLDYVLLMSYDFHGWEGKTGHNSPLFPRAEETTWRARLNTEWAAKEWNNRGVARSKIVIGMTTYARRFTLRDRNVNGVEAPAARSTQSLTYIEVCSEFLPGSTVVWDRDSQAHYAIKGDHWLSFDSVESLRIKTEWTVSNGFGGAMVWTLDQDDHANRCRQGAYPLLTTIRRGLFRSDGGSAIPPFPGSLSTVSAPTGTPPTTRPTTTRSTTPRIITPGSVDCARDPAGDYPIIGDCTAFIKCANGFEYIFRCPPTLFYDPVYNWCNYEDSVKPNRPDCPW